jgi:IS5 family transposase
LLKHIRHWSFAELEREVRANLLSRVHPHPGRKGTRCQDLGGLAQALGPEVIEKIHARMVALAQEHKVIRGRRLRLDTTVGEANIHYPIDSGLLGDGVRVLTRLMKKVTAIAGQAGSRLRDRSRSVQRRLIEIGRASRSKGPEAGERVQTAYGKLLAVTGRVVGQAKKFSAEIEQGVKRAAGVVRQAMLETLQAKLDTMRDRIQQVIRQTKARAFGGNTHVEGKLISLFEPDAEIIRKGKAGKPNEFGKMVKIQEAENQIIIA